MISSDILGNINLSSINDISMSLLKVPHVSPSLLFMIKMILPNKARQNPSWMHSTYIRAEMPTLQKNKNPNLANNSGLMSVIVSNYLSNQLPIKFAENWVAQIDDVGFANT